MCNFNCVHPLLVLSVTPHGIEALTSVLKNCFAPLFMKTHNIRLQRTGRKALDSQLKIKSAEIIYQNSLTDSNGQLSSTDRCRDKI